MLWLLLLLLLNWLLPAIKAVVLTLSIGSIILGAILGIGYAVVLIVGILRHHALLAMLP